MCLILVSKLVALNPRHTGTRISEAGPRVPLWEVVELLCLAPKKGSEGIQEVHEAPSSWTLATDSSERSGSRVSLRNQGEEAWEQPSVGSTLMLKF